MLQWIPVVTCVNTDVAEDPLLTTQPKLGHVRSTKALFDQQPFQQQRSAVNQPFQQQRSAVNQPFQQQRSAGDQQFGRSWTKGIYEQYWTLRSAVV